MTMLAILKAALPLADPSAVAPLDVRTALDQLNVPAGEVIRTGKAEFAKAIAAIAAGRDINYEGASGPVDFDSVGDVRGNLAAYRIVNGQFSLVQEYDCINHTADWNCPPVQK
jgi:branched-chain amino acid transport system substrate-binding protein